MPYPHNIVVLKTIMKTELKIRMKINLTKQ